MAKISVAIPPIATKRFEPPIARYRLPLEENMIRKNGRVTALYAEETVPVPGSETTSLYFAFVEKRKRLIALRENERDMESVVQMKRTARGDLGIEITPAGPTVYARRTEGIIKLDVLMYPGNLLEITPERASDIFPRLGNHPLYIHGIYAVIVDSGLPRIEAVSVTTFSKILSGEKYGRLFFGRKSPDMDYADRVIMDF